MINPIELSYQIARTVYCIRISMQNGATADIYNTVSQTYEAYNASNWAHYVIALTETIPGYYRALCPSASVAQPATEIYFEQKGGSPAVSDGPPIANGNSQGVNINTINGVQTDLGSNVSGIVDICNLALKHLGQKKITTLADDTEAARDCTQIFNNCRDEVLRSAAWKFATVIDTLTLLDAETAIGWSYVYTYPTDAVFIRKVFANAAPEFDFPIFNSQTVPVPTADPDNIEYRVVYQVDLGLQVILANCNPAYIEYTGRVTDPSLYDALFIKALSYKLAAELAVPLNGDKDQRTDMLNKYAAVFSEAAKNNAIETGVQQKNKSAYVDAR